MIPAPQQSSCTPWVRCLNLSSLPLCCAFGLRDNSVRWSASVKCFESRSSPQMRSTDSDSSIARLLSEAVDSGNQEVIRDLQTVAGDSQWQPQGASDISNKIFHTCFMGTTNSSRETRSRARDLAQTLGSYHLDVDIDTIVKAFTSLYSAVFLGRRLRYKTEPGGSVQEGLALQVCAFRSLFILLCTNLFLTSHVL